MTVTTIVFTAIAFYIGRRYGEHRQADRMRELMADVSDLARQVASHDPSYGLRVVDRDKDH